VIPIHINEDWNVITRTILPLIWQPSLQPAQTVPFGTGPTTFSAFLSPKNPTNGWLWAVGPVVQLPTISNETLGSPVWGGVPTAAIVYMKRPIVAAAVVNNVRSFRGTSGRSGTGYNTFLTQPFVNYNHPKRGRPHAGGPAHRITPANAPTAPPDRRNRTPRQARSDTSAAPASNRNCAG